MNELTLDLHEKMKTVITLIYETQALQAWAYEDGHLVVVGKDGDEESSIANLLRESYEMIEAEEHVEEVGKQIMETGEVT